MGDYTQAKLNGAPPEVLKAYRDKFVKDSSMNMNELKSSMVQPFLERGDLEGAGKALAAFRNPPQPKMPSVQERQEFSRQVRLGSELADVEQRYWKLKNEGRIPVGRLRQPFLDTLAVVETDDPELQSLRKSIEQIRAEYLLYLSGRAASDQERESIKKQIPSLFDSQQTFEQSLPEFQGKIKTNMSIDAGVLSAMGFKTPDGIPILPPSEVLKMGPTPNIITDNAYIPADVAGRHLKGIGVLGTQIGGSGEFRDKGGTSSEITEPPMSTETDAQLSPPTPTDPRMYKDPPKARGLLMEREQLMKELSE